jgi:hypothetical protein
MLYTALKLSHRRLRLALGRFGSVAFASDSELDN